MDCPVNLLEEINRSFEHIKQPPKEKKKKKRLNETLGSDSTHTRKRKKLFKMRSTLSRQTQKMLDVETELSLEYGPGFYAFVFGLLQEN